MMQTTAAIDDKRSAGIFSALVLVAVLAPIRQNWRRVPRDGFPLSYYPMFTAKRATSYRVTHLVGLHRDGGRTVIPYRYAGSGGLNQVRRQLARIARDGGAEELCRSVAERIAHRGERELADLEAVTLVTSRYHLDEYFRGDREPVAERLHARWPIHGARR